MSEKRKPDLLQEAPGKLFRRYFFNSVLSTTMLAVYVMVDTIFVGWRVGSGGLAALSVILPSYTLMVAFALMMGVGGATAMSFCKGQGEMDKANRLFTLAFSTAAGLSLVCGILGCIFWRPMAVLLGADQSIMEPVGQYLSIMNAGSVFFVVNNMMGVFVRNDHNPRQAMLAGVVSCFSNIGLDYFTMFILDWGMVGAALATVAGTVISIVILFWHFRSPHCTLRFRFGGVGLGDLLRVMRNGLPSFIAEASSGLIILLFNLRLMALEGVNAVTCYSIIANMAYLFMAVFNGASQTIQPLVSFNAGAGKGRRAAQFVRLGWITVLGCAILFVSLGVAFPQIIVQIFTQPTQEILQLGIPAIRIYFLAYLAMGVNIICSTFLQSIEQSKTASFLTLCRGVLFIIPLLFLLSSLMGVKGVWATVPVSEWLTLVMSFLFCRRVMAQLDSPGE